MWLVGLPEDVIVVHTCNMVHEVQMSTEDDNGLLTIGIWVGYIIMCFELFEM